MEEMRNVQKIQSGNLNVRDSLIDLGIDERILLQQFAMP
jgi:hypothetical protein